MTKLKRRIFSVFMTATLLFGMLPFGSMTALAAANVWDGSIATGFQSGTGTSDDPYIIATASQLAYLAQQVNGGSATYDANTCFKLTSDIDISSHAWMPIADFTGTFDGDGHQITGLNIGTSSARDTTDGYAGLFGYAETS